MTGERKRFVVSVNVIAAWSDEDAAESAVAHIIARGIRAGGISPDSVEVQVVDVFGEEVE